MRYREIPTAEVLAAAGEAVARAHPAKEVFVPIFTTNHCDAECRMCGMRSGNTKLVRKFAGRRAIAEQLTILRDHERVRAVGFLTGEFLDAYTRRTNAFLVGWAIAHAFELGFQRAYFNIGSMVPEEIETLADWVGDDRKDTVTMCVFQETYNRRAYAKFMGRDPHQIPKADFDRRLQSFDNWLDAGFRQVNPGFLVGLADVEEELVSLLHHVSHLKARGADVSISLPRLRPALGSTTKVGIDDDRYVRLISAVALCSPRSRIVLTTRETQEFQDLVLPAVGTISPGSPDVTPYRRDGEVPNQPESSQFVIPDHRRPRDVLARIVARGVKLRYFDSATNNLGE
jgi:2-iminoacetate synthase